MKTKSFKNKSNTTKNQCLLNSSIQDSKLSNEELNYIKGGDGEGSDKDPIKL